VRVDPGLYGCIAALMWILHRHGIAVPDHVARHRRLGPRYRRVLSIARWGVALLGAAIFTVAVAKAVEQTLPGAHGAYLYLAGVSAALALLVLVEAAVAALRHAITREAARARARRERARSVHTMMRLGLGPSSEQLF
jgi:heme exporter protein D